MDQQICSRQRQLAPCLWIAFEIPEGRRVELNLPDDFFLWIQVKIGIRVAEGSKTRRVPGVSEQGISAYSDCALRTGSRVIRLPVVPDIIATHGNVMQKRRYRPAGFHRSLPGQLSLVQDRRSRHGFPEHRVMFSAYGSTACSLLSAAYPA